MKFLHSSLFRSLAAAAVGILLVLNPSETAVVMISIIGLLFIIPGIVSVYTYFSSAKEDRAPRLFFPLVGVGSALLGLLLILYTDYFVTTVSYVIGAFLLLASTSQIASLWRLRKIRRVSVWLFAAPLVVFLTALFMLISPAIAVLGILGIAMLVYAFSEGLNAWKFRALHKPLPPSSESDEA